MVYLGFIIPLAGSYFLFKRWRKRAKYVSKLVSKELLLPTGSNHEDIKFSGTNRAYQGFYYTTVYVFDRSFDVARFKRALEILLETYPMLACRFERYEDNTGIKQIRVSKNPAGVEFNEMEFIGSAQNFDVKKALFSEDRAYFQDAFSCDVAGLFPSDGRIMTVTATKGFENGYQVVSFYLSHALFDMASFSMVLNDLTKISMDLKRLEKSNLNFHLKLSESEMLERAKQRNVVDRINSRVDSISKFVCAAQIFKVVLSTLNIYYSQKYDYKVNSEILSRIKDDYAKATNDWASSYEVFMGCILSSLAEKDEEDVELFIIVDFRGRCMLIPSNYVGNANGASWRFANEKVTIKVFRNDLIKTIAAVHEHLRSSLNDENTDLFYFFEALKHTNEIDRVWQFNLFDMYSNKAMLFNSWVNFKDSICGWSVNNVRPLLLSPVLIPMPYMVQVVPYSHDSNDFVFSLTLKSSEHFDTSHLPSGLFEKYF
jgi:hypothetical protein